MGELTRRELLTATTVGAVGVALGGGTGYALGDDHGKSSGQRAANDAVPFHGAHQAGIVTPAQDRLVFGAFDLTVSTASELKDLLSAWTQAAVAMTAGRTTGPRRGAPDAPPADTVPVPFDDHLRARSQRVRTGRP
jgi:deferrochelatase/peroxidase EfeB